MISYLMYHPSTHQFILEVDKMSQPNLTGKVCLVTGASRGIGRGIALQLAKSGATVYITGRKLEDLKKCAAEMKQSGGQIVIPLQGKSVL